MLNQLLTKFGDSKDTWHGTAHYSIPFHPHIMHEPALSDLSYSVLPFVHEYES